MIPIHGMPSAPHLDFAGQVRAATSLAVLHASKVDDVATARHAIREGKVDLVGMTRAHLADPHIVRKIVAGPGGRDPAVRRGDVLPRPDLRVRRGAVHPQRGDEPRGDDAARDPAGRPARRVVVVGAGPGGLEAARVAGERGHDVTCWRRCRGPAGRSGSPPATPAARDLLGIVEWRVSELARLGVDVRYDVLAEGGDVTALDPDVVIVATGGLPQLPELEDGAERMVTSWDVLGGDVTPTGDVLFFDDNGTHSAMSAAEMIARSGARLEIVTPERMLGIDVGGMNHVPYARAFNETDTRITLNQRVLRRATRGGRLCVEIGSDHSPAPQRAPRRLGGRRPRHGGDRRRSTSSSSRRRRNLGAVDYGALLGGPAAVARRQPRRPVPAVPHRRRRRQPQHPRRRLRRPAAGQGPLAIRGVSATGVSARGRSSQTLG